MPETVHHEPPAYRTTIEELRRETVIPLWATDRPNFAGVVGCSRWTAYADARAGRVPVLRVGRRVLVPVPRLLALLGAETAA